MNCHIYLRPKVADHFLSIQNFTNKLNFCFNYDTY